MALILSMLYKFFIGPLELFFEILYYLAYRAIDNPGLAIIFLSLAMNFLVLPLYRRADAMQEEQRDLAVAMKPWTEHIKRTFSGDERFMMQQTHNRQMGYKQTDILKSSISLLLEIPFFIAAFHFLSNLELLRGVPFGPIKDLGSPDALLSIAGISINALPILMTLINVVSAAIYLKGFPISSKIQTYGIAAIFLVLLYNSPAGLVFYWTLNNVFSLVKNIVYRVKHAFSPSIRKGSSFLFFPEANTKDDKTFLYGCIFMAVLIGLLIPTSVVAASPAEFAESLFYLSPVIPVVESFVLALGTFVLWFGVFYRLATPKGKSVFICLLFALAVVAIVNYLFFGTNYGNLSPQLQFDSNPSSSRTEQLLNIVILFVVAFVFAAIWLKKRDAIAKPFFLSLCVAALAMSVFNFATTSRELDQVDSIIAPRGSESRPTIPLSKHGKNVVVIMMDRAISYYVPFLMNELPGLSQQLQGFTYYPNAISYGAFTNVGTPGIYGGYDYTPERINERRSVSLAEKQNESLKVMPSLFSENGFITTIFDPTYAGYGWTPDLSIYDDLSNVKAYITMDGRFEADEFREETTLEVRQHEAVEELSRNLFCYSIFKTAPLAAQPYIYNKGGYNSPSARLLSSQTRYGSSRSAGVTSSFLKSYAVLQNMEGLTDILDSEQGTFLMMSNDTTHQPIVLSEPEFRPALSVNNTEYDEAHRIRYSIEGDQLEFPEEEGIGVSRSRIMHYEVNAAALRELGEWFDYLRENDVFDNTRIIIVSDHGQPLLLDEKLVLNINEQSDEEPFDLDMLSFNCFLLVKDFDSKNFVVSNEFMTTADTPSLALNGLIENPVNPFTGNAIDSSSKGESEQHIMYSSAWSTSENNGNTFLPGYWFAVKDNIFEAENWNYIGKY